MKRKSKPEVLKHAHGPSTTAARIWPEAESQFGLRDARFFWRVERMVANSLHRIFQRSGANNGVSCLQDG